jgi:hypothetical protein
MWESHDIQSNLPKDEKSGQALVNSTETVLKTYFYGKAFREKVDIDGSNLPDFKRLAKNYVNASIASQNLEEMEAETKQELAGLDTYLKLYKQQRATAIANLNSGSRKALSSPAHLKLWEIIDIGYPAEVVAINSRLDETQVFWKRADALNGETKNMWIANKSLVSVLLESPNSREGYNL